MSHPIDVLLGEKVHSLRNALRMDPATVGEALGLPAESVTEIEAGRKRLEAPDLVTLARLFQIEPAEFLHHVCPFAEIDPESKAINVFAGLDGDSLEFARLFSKIGNDRHRDAVMRLVRSLIDDPAYHQ